MPEPYMFGTKVKLKQGRHELPIAYLYNVNKVSTGEWRYRAVFPEGRFANVYSDEVDEVLSVESEETLALLASLR